MNKKNQISENYLEKVPVRNPLIKWTKDSENIVTLEIENTGFFNRMAQKFLHKPKISYIHLDETGSFIWPIIDGKKDIIALGISVKEHFGENAEPLYERLAKYFTILESYNFILWK